MVIYNHSSIFDRATGERQIAFLTSKVSLVSLAKLDLMMMPRLSLGGTFLAGEGTTRWPTLFFSRSLKCDKDSLKLVMTRPTMNSLVLFVRVENAPSYIQIRGELWPSRHYFSYTFIVVGLLLLQVSLKLTKV